MDEKIIKLAIDLHGHLAPGIALGLRMSELSLSQMGLSKGNKYLIGISETARCLADAMQAATGCTLGHGNAFVENYGKLAITIGDIKTKKGVRVALMDETNNLSPLMNKWMMRLGKLTHEEENELGIQLLKLDDKYFLIQNVEITRNQDFDNSKIVRCQKCNESIPMGLGVLKEDITYCKACKGETYYALLEAQKA